MRSALLLSRPFLPLLHPRIPISTSTRIVHRFPSSIVNVNVNVKRTMASSTQQPLQEWLIIVPDHKGALEKRIAVRSKHLEGIKSDREDMWLWGGAMLEEPYSATDSGPPKMKGSACLVAAATRDEVVERLKQDVYVKEGVWNLDEVQIIPFRSALRKAL